MERRRFLASAGAAGAVGLAGCAGLSGETETSVLWIRDGRDVYASVSADGEEVATAGVRFYSGTAADGPVSFEAWAEQERDTSFTDFELALTYENRNSELYMQPPSGRPWPEFHYLQTVNPPGARIEIPDLGTQAESTLTFGFLFDPHDDAPRLGFDVSFGLTTGGFLPTTWRCEASRNLEIPTHV